MVTGALTIIPPLVVLKFGKKGEMPLEELKRKCLEIDGSRFSRRSLRSAIETYSGCLVVDKEIVKFNLEATNYAKQKLSSMERHTQAILHGAVPNMEKWQLYPYKDRKNSKTCYIGIPWEFIPLDPFDRDSKTFPTSCNFRVEGDDSCRLGCGLSQERYKKLSNNI